MTSVDWMVPGSQVQRDCTPQPCAGHRRADPPRRGAGYSNRAAREAMARRRPIRARHGDESWLVHRASANFLHGAVRC